MKLKIRINKNKLSDSLSLNSGIIKVRFQKVLHEGSGMLATDLVRDLVEGYEGTVEFPDGKEVIYTVPPRPLFKEYVEEKHSFIRETIKKSYTLRFKRVKSQEQFTIAANEIKDDLAVWIKEGNVTPENTAFTVGNKGFNAPFYSTGELVSLLEGVYVPKN